MDKMLKAQQILIQIAIDNQSTHDNKRMEKSPSDDQITVFPINSYVLVAYPDEGMHKGPPEETMTNLKGHLRVLNNIWPL